MPRKIRTTLTRMTRLRIAIAYRNIPDTVVPITLVTWCSWEESCRTGPASDRTPAASRNVSRNTIVECPSEKKKPTPSGRLPSPISLRVVLSIAEM